MAIYDVRLIDPGEEGLAAALQRAMKAANRDGGHGTTRMARDAAFWGRFAKDVLRGGPEGRRRSCKGGSTIPEVVAAWWTDPAGRKHVRLLGRSRRPWMRMRGEVELRGLPPWWHLYPEAVLGVRGANTGERFIAACRCGAVGTPESLGWMGDTCGPCFDRRADGGEVAGGFGQFGGWATGLGRFAFTADGRHLVGPGLTGVFRTLDRADGRAVNSKKRFGVIVAMAVGARGTVVAQNDGLVYRQPPGAPDLEPVLRSRQDWASRSALAPDGSRFVMLTYQHAYTADLTAARPQYERYPLLDGISALRYTPDGARLLGTTHPAGELHELDVARSTSTPVRRGIFDGLSGAYASPNEFAVAPDGGAVLIRRQAYHPSRVLVRHVPLAGGPTTDLRIPDWHLPTALAYSPDGRHAVTADTESGWIGFWEVPSGKSLGFVRAVLEDQAWRGGQVEFAPNGGALAVSYSTGHGEHGSTIAVWPWPEVLAAAG